MSLVLKVLFTESSHDYGSERLASLEEILNKRLPWIRERDDALEIWIVLDVYSDPSRLRSLQMDARSSLPMEKSPPVDYVGLVNQGATCYMNSVLQTLGHLPVLTRAVFQMPTSEDAATETRSIPLALQRLFYSLHTKKQSVSTRPLTASFGWTSRDAFMQHDVQEFCRVLMDTVEERMKATEVEGTMERLFSGKWEMFVECLHVNQKSTKNETFYDLSLDVKGCTDLYASFKRFGEVEILCGENQYKSQSHGLQDARKGVRFLSLPPILQIQLKRFEFDPVHQSYCKVHDRFEFYDRIDLNPIVAPGSIDYRYRLHSVLVHLGTLLGGHYYAYIRPGSSPDSPWYKFDDELVSKVSAYQAIDENFGGNNTIWDLRSSRTMGTRATPGKLGSAYMLVYVRESEVSEYLAPLTRANIPQKLVDQFEAEETLRQNLQRERIEQSKMIELRVLFEEDLFVSSRNRLELISPRSRHNMFKVPKTSALRDVVPVIEQHCRFSVGQSSVFEVRKRVNGTVRPGELQCLSRCVLSLPDEIMIRWTRPSDNGGVLLVAKYYDVDVGELSVCGSLLYTMDTIFEIVAEDLKRLVDLGSDDEEIDVWEERCVGTRDGIVRIDNYELTLNALGLVSGDILCFQRYTGRDECPTYLESLYKEVDVVFSRVGTNGLEGQAPIHIKVRLHRDDHVLQVLEALVSSLKSTGLEQVELCNLRLFVDRSKHKPLGSIPSWATRLPTDTEQMGENGYRSSWEHPSIGRKNIWAHTSTLTLFQTIWLPKASRPAVDPVIDFEMLEPSIRVIGGNCLVTIHWMPEPVYGQEPIRIDLCLPVLEDGCSVQAIRFALLECESVREAMGNTMRSIQFVQIVNSQLCRVYKDGDIVRSSPSGEGQWIRAEFEEETLGEDRHIIGAFTIRDSIFGQPFTLSLPARCEFDTFLSRIAQRIQVDVDRLCTWRFSYSHGWTNARTPVDPLTFTKFLETYLDRTLVVFLTPMGEDIFKKRRKGTALHSPTRNSIRFLN